MNLAVILSGGAGMRMGADIPKQYMELLGKPVLVHTAEQFQRCGLVEHIVIVAAREWEDRIWAWKERFGLSKLCALAPAGENRQRSILSGLLAARDLFESQGDGVIIQDAARPLTGDALIESLLEGLKEAPAILPALPVTDTVYTSADGGRVDGLLDRSKLYARQAPEAFSYKRYLELYLSAAAEELDNTSGSCQLPYQVGWDVKIIPGERDNIKVTYPEDIELCEKILKERGWRA